MCKTCRSSKEDFIASGRRVEKREGWTKGGVESMHDAHYQGPGVQRVTP